MAAVTCPGCGASAPSDLPTVPGQTAYDDRSKPTTWWCLACLNRKVHAARHDLGMCHCDEIAGPHEHPAAVA